MNGFQNQYMNPYGMNGYGQFQTSPVMPTQPKQLDMVNGRNGAMQYPMGPNQKAWILDESGLVSWLIQTDSACYRTVTPYDVAPHQDEPAPDYKSLEQRVKRLEESENARNTTDSTATRKKPNGNKADDSTD